MKMLKSLNTGKPIQIGDHLFVGMHSADQLIEYEVLVIDAKKRQVWASVVMSPRKKPIGFRDWLKAEDLDCVWS